MNKEITSEKNYKYKHILKKYIPSIKYKRPSSLDRENLRLKKRNDSFKPEEAISHNTFLNVENSNAKTSLDILNTQRNANKRFSLKKKYRNNSIKIGKCPSPNPKEKEIINKNLIKILENKEKAKTFNRKGSKQKINIENKNNANSHLINNNKKNNLPRVKSGAFRLNKQKLLNQKKLSNDNMNNNFINENKKMNNNKNNHIKNKIEKTQNNNKINTDSIIQLKNKIQKKKNNQNNQNKKKIMNKMNSNNMEIIKQKSEANLKNESQITKPIIKLISPISINNISNDNNQIPENSLSQRKNIDINLDYQVNPKCQKNDFNNTTSKIKIKMSDFVAEMNKDKEFFHYTENNSIVQSKSRSKIKYNYIIKQSDSKIKHKKIILNKKKFDEKKIPFFIRKCGSLNENKNYYFNKNKINEKSPINLTEHNQKGNNYLDEYSNQLEETINMNDIYSQNKIKKENLNRIESNKISKKKSVNKNAENSFSTINFYNSFIIDENNNNESKNNFDHMLKNYNFVSNRNSDNNKKINNIIKINIINNKNIHNNIKNYHSKKDDNNNLNNCNNSNKNIEKIDIPSIPIKDYKNAYNSALLNNNFSNCNTGNTSDNNPNNMHIQKNIQNNNNKILNEKIENNDNINNKNETIKIEYTKNENKKDGNIKNENNKNENNKEDNNRNENNKNEIDKEEKEDKEKNKDIDKNSENNNNILNIDKKDIINNRMINKNQIEEKDFSLDKSTSLRLFPVVHEDFVEKEDEVIKLLNSQLSKESKKDNIIYPYSNNNEEESEIIFQNSDYSKEISLLVNNDSKFNKNIYQNIYNINNNYNFVNIQNPNINIDNVGLKDTSIISNIGIKGCKSITQAGKERTGHRKKNQDFYIIEKNINNILGFNIFAILDGHGVNGHFVSQFASKLILKKFINITNKFKDTESIYNDLKKKDFQKIIDIFLEIDKQIMEQKGFDISLSGTTCCLVIQLYEHIICSNIGDSRGILIYDDNKIFELSHDSKPEVPEETKRINLMGGNVDQAKNEYGEKTGPYRVYINNMDLPGLAMSRSFGDKKAKSCGVIPYPDIIEYTLNNDSKYMVICSDGVWEFLSNEDVMKLGNKYYTQNNINDFCSELLKKSTDMWELEENYIDDITIVTIFF